MDDWTDLRAVLAELAAADPLPLRAWPDFNHTKPGRGPRPPHAIWLEPWATDVAERLHQRYGADVDLRVGALSYPGRRTMTAQPAPAPTQGIDQAGVTATVDGPVSVRSGHATTCALLVGNRTTEELTVVTGAFLLADVVDPAGGRIVGGHSAPMDLVRRAYAVPPGGTTAVPLRIATDSFEPDLGYAVPPGTWAIEVALDLEGRPFRTPQLPLTVTGVP